VVELFSVNIKFIIRFFYSIKWCVLLLTESADVDKDDEMGPRLEKEPPKLEEERLEVDFERLSLRGA
jgi:hypothetical protein